MAETNSVRDDNDAYVGVSEEYKNAAYEQNDAQHSDDDEIRASEERARENEEDHALTEIGWRGFIPDTPHPTDRDPNKSVITGPASVRVETQDDDSVEEENEEEETEQPTEVPQPSQPQPPLGS